MTKDEALAQPDAFEQGRQKGMKQERALWELSRRGQEIEADPPKIGCVQHDCDECKARLAQPVQEPVALREALADALGGVYGCSRTWSAWGVGTMSQGDFYPAAESDEVLDELVQAVAAATPPLPEQEPVFCEYCGGNDDADFGLPTDHCTDCPRPQQRPWVGLMRGVRVEGDTVVISVKGGNDAARELCGALLEEKNK